MISAIVLAAGLSQRMGKPKMLLPWGETTVIGKIISTLADAGIPNPYIVTGGNQADLANALRGMDAQFVYNEDYANGEMLLSMQVGLKAVGKDSEAVLVVLGDQPQIETYIVKEMIIRFESTHNSLIVPSYRLHRGHPWVLGKSYWKEILALRLPDTLRDFLNMHGSNIDYMVVDSASVLQDLDTQRDYSNYKPT